MRDGTLSKACSFNVPPEHLAKVTSKLSPYQEANNEMDSLLRYGGARRCRQIRKDRELKTTIFDDNGDPTYIDILFDSESGRGCAFIGYRTRIKQL